MPNEVTVPVHGRVPPEQQVTRQQLVRSRVKVDVAGRVTFEWSPGQFERHALPCQAALQVARPRACVRAGSLHNVRAVPVVERPPAVPEGVFEHDADEGKAQAGLVRLTVYLTAQ